MSPYDEDRLPDHERRRRELVALLAADEPNRRRRAVPAIAAVAVLAMVSVGVVAAQRWGGPESLPSAGPARGQDPSAGVPRDAATVGDPVPWDIAGRTLATCLANGRRYAVPPPMPTGFGSESPPGPPPTVSPDPSGSPTRGTPPSGGSSPEPKPGTATPESTAVASETLPPGGTPLAFAFPTGSGFPEAWGSPAPSDAAPPGRTGSSPDPQLWQMKEPVSAFKPYFTAWEADGFGGLRPFVLGKAGGAGLAVCHGDPPAPDFPAPGYADGVLKGPLDLRTSPVGPAHEGAPTAVTWWGRATAAVARVSVTLPDGTVVPAVVRGGIWFASGVGGPATAPQVTAFDASGVPVVSTGRTHWG